MSRVKCFVSWILADCNLVPLSVNLCCRTRSDGIDGEPPQIDQSMGSVEINNVSDTVMVLYKIVRAASK